MSWIIAALIAIVIYTLATNLCIVSDREMWVTERLGSRRFLKKGIRLLLPFGMERTVCKIPMQPQLVEMRGERFNIPEGTCGITASLEYQIYKPQKTYDRILTKNDQSLDIQYHIQTMFVAAMRDVVKRLPIEALCEDEEDDTLASKLRERIESDLVDRGLRLISDNSLKIQEVRLDAQAENARRLKYEALKKIGAKNIYSKGQIEAVKFIMSEMGVDQAVAMTYYQQLQALATMENVQGLFISDLLSPVLLNVGRHR